MSIANQIRQLAKDGSRPDEISTSLVVSLDYVKKVLKVRSDKRNIEELLRALIREQRDTNHMLRLLLKMPRHPIDRLGSDI